MVCCLSGFHMRWGLTCGLLKRPIPFCFSFESLIGQNCPGYRCDRQADGRTDRQATMGRSLLKQCRKFVIVAAQSQCKSAWYLTISVWLVQLFTIYHHRWCAYCTLVCPCMCGSLYIEISVLVLPIQGFRPPARWPRLYQQESKVSFDWTHWLFAYSYSLIMAGQCW